jgi:O-antigen/teichoic acid export membrane protein
MAVAHLVQFMLGLVSAALVFVTAGPMAAFFGVPEAAWALRLLALLPILRALSHLDAYRMTRDLRYGPSVLVDVVPQVVSTLVAWPLASLWPTYAVLVWLLIGKQAVSTLASHLVAETRYRWSFDRGNARDIMTFGWPMVASGFLMFGIMQGDRFAVGMGFPIADLGAYSIAGSLVLVPVATLFKLSGWIMLPLMSSARDDEARYRRLVSDASRMLSLFSGIYAVTMILAGGTLVVYLFGEKYRGAGALTLWLGIAQALRLLSNVPTVSAVARGDTRNVMFSNVLRLSGVALAFVLASVGSSLVLIAVSAVVGEGIALIGSFWRFSRKQGVSAEHYLRPLLLAAGFMCLSCGLAWSGLSRLPTWISLGTAALVVVAFIFVHLGSFADSRRVAWSLITNRRLFLSNQPSDVVSRP